MTNIGKRTQTQKPLGAYLVEAGIITQAQVEIAMNEQNDTARRLGEILVERGWVKQQTIEYFMEKLVLPQRRAVRKKLFDQPNSYNLNLLEQVSPAELEDSNLLLLSARPTRELKVYLYPKKTIRFLLLIVLGLVLANLIVQFSTYFLPDYPFKNSLIKLFDINGEQNVAALYSSSALLFCAILLAIIALFKTSDRYFYHWRVLSIIFLFLSLDEAISIHEKMIPSLRSALNAGGFLYYTWVIPGSIFVLICLLAFWKFLTYLPARIKRLFIVAGAIFVAGSLGTELVGGYYHDLYGQQNINYLLSTTIEESLEMLGIVIFIYALLLYMSSCIKGVNIQVQIIDDTQRRSA